MLRTRDRSRGGTGGGGVTPPFNPALPNISLYLDASDLSTLWADTGATTPATNSLARWDDKSGLGNNATQATAANMPSIAIRSVNGKPCVNFDAVNDDMGIPTAVFQTGAMTLVTVHVPNSNNTTQQVICTDGLGGGSYRTQIRNQGADMAATPLNRPNVNVSMPIISVARVSGSGVGVTERFRINNETELSAVVTRNATAITRADLGVFGSNGTGRLNGAICYVLAYKRELSDVEVDYLVAGLQDIWITDMKAVTVQNRYANGRISSGVTDGAVNRFAHIVAADTNVLYVSYPASYIDTTNSLNLSNSYTIDKVSVEGLAGAVAPVPFYGGRSQFVSDNASDIHTMALPASVFGLPKFTAGEIYTFKTEFTIPAGGFLPSSTVGSSDYAGNQMVFYEKALNTPSDTDLPGVYTFTGGGTPVNASTTFTPMVWGIPINPVKAWMAFGDSKTFGSNDGTSGGIYGRAVFQRSMRSATNDDLLPSINISKQGLFTTAFVNSNHVRAFLRYCNNYYIRVGVNDYGSTGTGITAATYRTNMDAITAQFANLGYTKRIAVKLGPRVGSSADNWSTSVGQVVAAGWLLGQPPYQGNDELDLMVVAGTLTQALDFTVERDGIDPTKWFTNGTPDYTTNDGLHETAQGHEDCAVVFRVIARS